MTTRFAPERRRGVALLLPALALLACSAEPPSGNAATPDAAYSPPSTPTPTALANQAQAVTPGALVQDGDALPAVTTATYACDGDRRIDVRFDNRAGNATLRVADDLPAVLTQQRAASGIWYRGDGYELRGKGDAATITLPGVPPLQCRSIN